MGYFMMCSHEHLLSFLLFFDVGPVGNNIRYLIESLSSSLINCQTALCGAGEVWTFSIAIENITRALPEIATKWLSHLWTCVKNKVWSTAPNSMLCKPFLMAAYSIATKNITWPLLEPSERLQSPVQTSNYVYQVYAQACNKHSPFIELNGKKIHKAKFSGNSSSIQQVPDLLTD